MEKKFDTITNRYNQLSDEEMIGRSTNFLNEMKQRRTIRFFSEKPVPREVIENCIRSASTAPSGANCQPWHFVVVEKPEIKHSIRVASEKNEKEFYHKKAPQEWLDALAPLELNEEKPFLGQAPCFIVIFVKRYDVNEQGEKIKQYYINESIGIATGMLITALHNAGLGTLTYTPSPMGFLNAILNRPENERAYMVLVAGHPTEDCKVPELQRKSLEEITSYL